jgi:hypothetical protein
VPTSRRVVGERPYSDRAATGKAQLVVSRDGRQDIADERCALWSGPAGGQGQAEGFAYRKQAGIGSAPEAPPVVAPCPDRPRQQLRADLDRRGHKPPGCLERARAPSRAATLVAVSQRHGVEASCWRVAM